MRTTSSNSVYIEFIVESFNSFLDFKLCYSSFNSLTYFSEIDWNDPSVEFDSETINNLNIPNVEHSDGFRSGIRAWNRTVQFWLANFVYRRSSRSIR